MREHVTQIAFTAIVLLTLTAPAPAQTSYGPYCDAEEVQLLKKSRFADSEIRSLCSSTSGTGFSPGSKYNWEICRFNDRFCRPSNACVATRSEMNAVIRANGHRNVWYTTGKISRSCGSSNTIASTKYRWEVCRFSDKFCRPSNACVATKSDMDAVIRANGHTSIWYTTGRRGTSC